MEAEIIEVIPRRVKVVDVFTGKKADTGSFVRVQQADGVVHNFMNGSINGIAEEHRVVGLRGRIVWQGTETYALPYFIPNAK